MELKALIKFLIAQGMSVSAISKNSTVSRSSLDHWLVGQKELSQINRTRLVNWIKIFTNQFSNLLQECGKEC